MITSDTSVFSNGQLANGTVTKLMDIIIKHDTVQIMCQYISGYYEDGQVSRQKFDKCS